MSYTPAQSSAPKHPPNAHFQFRKLMIPIFGDKFKQMGKDVSIPILSKILARVWNGLKDDDGQAPYYAIYKAKMNEYSAAMRGTNGGTIPSSQTGVQVAAGNSFGSGELPIEIYSPEVGASIIRRGRGDSIPSRRQLRKAEGHSVSRSVSLPVNPGPSTWSGFVFQRPYINAESIVVNGLPRWESLTPGHVELHRPAMAVHGTSPREHTSTNVQQRYPPGYTEHAADYEPYSTTHGYSQPTSYMVEDTHVGVGVYRPVPKDVAIVNNHAGWTDEDIQYARTYTGVPELAFLWDANFQGNMSITLNTLYTDEPIPDDWLR